MIILLDTSSPTVHLVVVDGEQRTAYEWEAHRELAKGLLGWIETSLGNHGAALNDITAIGVFKGPGSFTGLRIGMAVMNTLADSLAIPIVATTGDAWLTDALERLQDGQNDNIALPLYDREANITKPRK